MPVQPDSFSFSGVDMLAAYGIRGTVRDVLQPKLRPRLLTIPARSGSYDFKAKFYEDRHITIDCDNVSALSRAAIRELSFLLSRKGPLVLWDEPELYYIGRVYGDAELTYLGRIGHRFSLTFVCDPFAYGRTVSGPVPDIFHYEGTAETPTRLEIVNTGNTPIQGIRMRTRERSQ